METLVIEAKTKQQAKTLKAISEALGMKYRTTAEFEKLEDVWMAKLMDESNGERLSMEEQNDLFEKMRMGKAGNK